jgi:hypothetical protein
MTEHVHVDAPHELSDLSGGTSWSQERLWEFAATFLLAVATLGIAWSGYQAARWSGLQSERYAQANTVRAQETRVSTAAGQDRLQDLLNFNRWLEVSTQGNQQLADLYVRRFRPEFLPAFNAWLAQDLLHNPAAVASPLLMPQYRPAKAEQVNRLDAEGNQRFEQGKVSTEDTDNYVLTTVFFAAVLFFAGISLRFKWQSMRLVVIVFAALFLGYGLARIALLPAR